MTHFYFSSLTVIHLLIYILLLLLVIKKKKKDLKNRRAKLEFWHIAVHGAEMRALVILITGGCAAMIWAVGLYAVCIDSTTTQSRQHKSCLITTE